MKAEKYQHIFSRRGFTLLEIIVSITIAGIMGAMLIQFAGTAVTLSANPVKIVRDEVTSQGIMEEIISQYVMEMNAAPATALATLVTFISSETYSSNVTTSYITFATDGTEQSSGSPTNTLKVLVQINAHKQTVLFSKSLSSTDEPEVAY
jgi:prepilin-type N-terminal cleavage/methylation domain-containing protein